MATPRRWAIVSAVLWGCAGGVPSQKGPVATSVGSTASAGESSEGDPSSDTGFVDEEGSAEKGDTFVGSSSESTSGGGESSSDGGGDSSSSDTGVAPSCPQEATCATATVIGMVSGDESSDPIQIMGAEPTWVTFQVTEDNDSVAGEAVTFTATLDSPGGSDFDMYVYRGASNGTTGCNGVEAQSTSAGPQDVVHMSWGEAAVANGGDDRAWIAIEIRPKDDCDGLTMWTLTIEGDT